MGKITDFWMIITISWKYVQKYWTRFGMHICPSFWEVVMRDIVYATVLTVFCLVVAFVQAAAQDVAILR